jgi:hypothetical protein
VIVTSFAAVAIIVLGGVIFLCQLGVLVILVANVELMQAPENARLSSAFDIGPGLLVNVRLRVVWVTRLKVVNPWSNMSSSDRRAQTGTRVVLPGRSNVSTAFARVIDSVGTRRSSAVCPASQVGVVIAVHSVGDDISIRVGMKNLKPGIRRGRCETE